MVNEPLSVQYRGIIGSFNLAQKPLTHEKLMAKMQSSIRSGVSFGGPQTEPDPDCVKVSFHVQELESFGEITIARDVVKKFQLMVEDPIIIVVRRPVETPSQGSNELSTSDAAAMHGTINVIMADPASPLNRRRSYQSLSKMYPFLLPQVPMEQLYKATEQEGIEKPSDLVRLDLWNQTTQTHGTLPIRKEDLARLDLLTGDRVVVMIKKSHPVQKV